MKTAALAGVNNAINVNSIGKSTDSGQGVSFGEYLTRALGDVQTLQDQAEQGAARMALGQEDYIHNTVLAFEKANLALQLTIQVRDKIVEAFQELMRIQM